jgi:hypothetical protein
MMPCRLYTPGPYFTADQLAELKGQATITIQRFARGWLARRRARRLGRLKGEREDFLMTQVRCSCLSPQPRCVVVHIYASAPEPG